MRKKKITTKEAGEIAKLGVEKSDKRELIIQALFMIGGVILSILMLYFFLPAKINDQYWLVGFCLLGILIGGGLYIKFGMKKSMERRMSSVLSELEKEIKSRKVK